MRLCYPDLPGLPLARPMWVATPSTVGTPVRRSSCSAVVQADWHDAEPLMHLFRSCRTIRRHRTPRRAVQRSRLGLVSPKCNTPMQTTVG